MKEIDAITIEEIKTAFENCSSKSEVIEYFGKKINGSGWRFVWKLMEKANIRKDYFENKITEELYSKNPKYCEYCGKELTYKQRFNKFCSSSCAASFNNKNRGEHSFDTKKKISDSIRAKNPNKEYAEYTGKPLQKKTIEEKRNEIITEWLNGKNFVRGASQVPSFIRQYLMDIHNNKCEKCGWGEANPATGKIPLEVHHIDGDCTNNRIENLQLLCPNCHSLTENFGSKNKNSKRFHRKKMTLKDMEEPKEKLEFNEVNFPMVTKVLGKTLYGAEPTPMK